ncbi:MAG: hypothetical protein U0M06_05165 [Clostridia bacterium]|nr:hypothetical protein [Clostridia bacterium]
MIKRYFIEIVKYDRTGSLGDILLKGETESKDSAITIFMDFIKKARETGADGVILSFGLNSEYAEIVERWGRGL